MPVIGSRAQVMHGTAHHTSGGLTKADLKYNKFGRIVSARKSALGKRSGFAERFKSMRFTRRGSSGGALRRRRARRRRRMY